MIGVQVGCLSSGANMDDGCGGLAILRSGSWYRNGGVVVKRRGCKRTADSALRCRRLANGVVPKKENVPLPTVCGIGTFLGCPQVIGK